MKRVCVIGGNRYFGRRLVELLVADGIEVTVVNRGSRPPPPGATPLRVDRDDGHALRSAIGGRRFDVVVDQVCYEPRQAAVACQVFAGRTDRYLMTSTVEVYDPHSSTHFPPSTQPAAPVAETRVDPETWVVEPNLPWSDHDFRSAHYAEGKRQAEAVFTHDGSFDFASIRCAHVLGPLTDDVTGRLESYVRAIVAGDPIAVYPNNRRASFISDRGIAAALRWACQTAVTGPVNVAAAGEWDVYDLCATIAAVVGAQPAYRIVEPGESASPFAFDRYYAMDTARARDLGCPLPNWADSLNDHIRAAVSR